MCTHCEASCVVIFFNFPFSLQGSVSLVACCRANLGSMCMTCSDFVVVPLCRFLPYNQHVINQDLAFTINKFTLKRSIHISAVNSIGSVKICGRRCSCSRSCDMQRLNVEGRSIFVRTNLWEKSSPRGLKSAILGQGFHP
jgi:hypothetical protein